MRSEPNRVALSLRVLGRNHLALQRLEMSYRGIDVVATEQGIWLSCYKGGVGFAGTIVEPECAIEIAGRLPQQKSRVA